MKPETREKKVEAIKSRTQAANEAFDSWSQTLYEDEREGIRDLIKQAAALTRMSWAYCPECREKVQVETPDFNGAAKLLDMFIKHTAGMPVQRVQTDHRVEIDVTHRQITELSTEELLQLASAEDAEIVE